MSVSAKSSPIPMHSFARQTFGQLVDETEAIRTTGFATCTALEDNSRVFKVTLKLGARTHDRFGLLQQKKIQAWNVAHLYWQIIDTFLESENSPSLTLNIHRSRFTDFI